jgi:hypothetical protein
MVTGPDPYTGRMPVTKQVFYHVSSLGADTRAYLDGDSLVVVVGRKMQVCASADVKTRGEDGALFVTVGWRPPSRAKAQRG